MDERGQTRNERMRIMNKNQIKAIAAAVGYFVLYACSMLLFQSVFTMGLMGQKFALGIRNEAAFVDSANNNFLLTMLLTVASVGLTFYLIFRLRGKNVRREWRINPFASRSLLLSVLVAVAYSAAYSWLSNQLAPDEVDPISRSIDYYQGLQPGLGLVMLMLNIFVAAPVVEEIVMRGVVYTRIDKACGKWPAVIVSSLLFGLMHIAAGGLILAVGAVLMGAIFAFILAKTNSLTACIIAHAAANIPDFMVYITS